MAVIGTYLKEKSGLKDAAKSLQSARDSTKSDATAQMPPTKPNEPAPPADLKYAIAAGLQNKRPIRGLLPSTLLPRRSPPQRLLSALWQIRVQPSLVLLVGVPTRRCPNW